MALAAASGEVVTAGTDDTAHWASLPVTECGSPAVQKLPGAPLGLSACAAGTAIVLTNKARVGFFLLPLLLFSLSTSALLLLCSRAARAASAAAKPRRAPCC